ncbi:hypothetical protein ACFW9D_11220 [Streptomyces sp. NPDC059524]|uniref:hypothetical protein n=1 Tax=Streptomyces sp. NPDC059524 TaxID=3346856 RepID=UPI003689205B
MNRRRAPIEGAVRGGIGAPDFAAAWWEAHRAVQAAGERPVGALAALLDQVFLVLEDYSPDSALREPGDLTGAGLRQAVRELTSTQEGGPRS